MIRRKRIPIKKKEEKTDFKDRICKRCVHSYLMQSDKTNPIVSECTKTKERFVASTPHVEKCGFEENKSEPIIHEMIYLNRQ